LRSEDPAIQALREQATAAIDQGRYDEAERLLSAAETEELVAAKEFQAAAEQRLRNAAATRAERGELSLVRLSYLEAALHFKEASERVPASEYQARGDYLNRYGFALYRHGDEKGDNTVLLQAIGIYRKALSELTRERVPLQWATTQNNLGNALSTLRERESGSARLEEAVAAYRAALQEYTRERVPLDWAMTQNNLGTALMALGERESGSARLEEAVGAYRAALQEHTRERVPLRWATTQNNLGTALKALGERESGSARLEEAVAAYRNALDVFKAANAEYYAEVVERNLISVEATLSTEYGKSP